MNRNQPFGAVVKVLLVTGVLCGAVRITLPGSRAAEPSGAGPSHSVGKKVLKPARDVQIDLDKATRIAMPAISKDLAPAVFKTPDGKTGWAVRIPGGRPIATPAYADGKIFVGGGYGSHEFYALNAKTGEVAWQIKTSDDGPSAAVVAEGCVAFNTESCTVIVTDESTGKVLWQEWLGDPLMSQPAIANGRLYMAHPSGQRGHASAGFANGAEVSQQAASNNTAPLQSHSGAAPGKIAAAPYALLCADLRTGKHIWEQGLPADVISAPVLDGDKVYLSCFNGDSFCLKASDGSILWKKANSAASAPLIVGGDVLLTLHARRNGKSYEGIQRMTGPHGETRDKTLLAEGNAEYLAPGKGGGVAIANAKIASLDASVGFAAPPAAAGLSGANQQVGVSSVAGGWAYQGSRATFNNGQIMNAQGAYLNAVTSKNGMAAWRAHAMGTGIGAGSQVFSPPAVGHRDLYLCSALGHLLSVRQQDGKVGFLYSTGQPMAFQPALAGGSIYAGTTNGMLICIQTGDADVDGWTAWGGNAQHNKKG